MVAMPDSLECCHTIVMKIAAQIPILPRLCCDPITPVRGHSNIITRIYLRGDLNSAQGRRVGTIEAPNAGITGANCGSYVGAGLAAFGAAAFPALQLSLL